MFASAFAVTPVMSVLLLIAAAIAIALAAFVEAVVTKDASSSVAIAFSILMPLITKVVEFRTPVVELLGATTAPARSLVTVLASPEA